MSNKNNVEFIFGNRESEHQFVDDNPEFVFENGEGSLQAVEEEKTYSFENRPDRVEYVNSEISYQYDYRPSYVNNELLKSYQYGWAVYTDTEFTEELPQEIEELTSTRLRNNGQNNLNFLRYDFKNHVFNENGIIRSLNNGDSYSIRIGFFVEPEIINTGIKVSLDIGGDIGEIQSTIINLPFNVNNPVFVTSNFLVYALDTFLENGAEIKVFSTDPRNVWGTETFVRVDHKNA